MVSGLVYGERVINRELEKIVRESICRGTGLCCCQSQKQRIGSGRDIQKIFKSPHLAPMMKRSPGKKKKKKGEKG